jgi:hypothetical protein
MLVFGLTDGRPTVETVTTTSSYPIPSVNGRSKHSLSSLPSFDQRWEMTSYCRLRCRLWNET